MSLRRKSCNACFQGRRKCDLALPTCERCKKTGKVCQYVTEPATVAVESSGSTASSAEIMMGSKDERNTDSSISGSQTLQQSLIEGFSLDLGSQNVDFDFDTQALLPIVPNLVGELGDLLPLCGKKESWQWIAEQLQECPKNFAKAGENVFIHRSMYCVQPPPAISAAFGICTASQMVTPATRAMFISSLEGEMRALLNDVETESIAQGLARLQAMLLYQILRLLSGDPAQNGVAEQHKSVLNAWALRLLQQMRTGPLRSLTYEDLVLAESVRRTVMVTYLLHAMGSIFKHGICPELPTLALLPVSVDAEAWASSEVSYALPTEGDPGVLRYGEWTDMWVAFPPRRRLDAFQKMLMVACKGKAKIEELEAEAV